MNRKTLYLILAIAGTIVPQMAVSPFYLEHGLDPTKLLHLAFSSPISALGLYSIIISCITLVVLNHTEGREMGIKTWIPAVAMGLFGIASGLPLYLYLRERAKGLG